jgi:hypothetical protein
MNRTDTTFEEFERQLIARLNAIADQDVLDEVNAPPSSNNPYPCVYSLCYRAWYSVDDAAEYIALTSQNLDETYACDQMARIYAKYRAIDPNHKVE